MRKLILFVSVIGVSFACSKDKLNTSSDKGERKSDSTSFMSEYEYFESPEDPNAVLDDFIEESQSSADFSINEAVWTLEGSLNYFFRHKPFTWESHEVVTYDYDLDITEDVVAGSDLKSVYSGIATEVLSQVDGETVAYQVGDVSVTGKTTGTLSIRVNVVLVQGFTFTTTILPENPTSDRKDWGPQHCDGSSAPDGGDDYIEKLTYNKLFNASSIPVYVYHYGLNVHSFQDGGNIPPVSSYSIVVKKTFPSSK